MFSTNEKNVVIKGVADLFVMRGSRKYIFFFSLDKIYPRNNKNLYISILFSIRN